MDMEPEDDWLAENDADAEAEPEALGVGLSEAVRDAVAACERLGVGWDVALDVGLGVDRALPLDDGVGELDGVRVAEPECVAEPVLLFVCEPEAIWLCVSDGVEL